MPLERILSGSALAALLLALGCSGEPAPPGGADVSTLDDAARAYVKLVLEVGRHDGDYVDAYYGPEEWREPSRSEALSLDAIRRQASGLVEAISARTEQAPDEMSRLRRSYLLGQLRSLVARVDLLDGSTMSFDDESKALYGAVAPTHADEHFQGILGELDSLLPGEGPLIERYEQFRRAFVIPRDRLDAVFRTAIAACRDRTLQHVELPDGESFEIEYVTGKPWSAYNWYQGEYHSLIQVNTDLPIFIDRALDLACHEGYPGHHVYNALLEQHLTRERGWVEFYVYPLFSPQSLIAEGTANYGIQIVFPERERIAFERDTLFPIAGLDPEQAALYYEVQDKVDQLSYAGNEAARRYLDGEIDADAAAEWLARYRLMSPDRARQRLRFLDNYRTYVINYNLGKDLVRHHIETRAGADPERRWDEFVRLLSSPRLPSDLD